MDNNASLCDEPGTIVLDGRLYRVPKPTPSEMLRVAEQMKALASKRCADPVEFAASYAPRLAPAVAALLLSEALKVGLSGSRASVDAALDEYVTVEGLRWRVWFHALRHAGYDPAIADGLVTDGNRFEVATALDKALDFEALDPKVQGPTSGTGG